MTPLAHRIVKELTVPLKHRLFQEKWFAAHLSGAHCFDVTDVHMMAVDLCRGEFEKIRGSSITTFLPAPKTWIEYRDKYGARTGWLLEEASSGSEFCDVTIVVHDDAQNAFQILSEKRRISLSDGWINTYNGETSPNFRGLDLQLVVAFLLFINSPKVIGRTQHTPHRGLERALVRQQKVIGKFPLHAWTEIKLRVSAPEDMSEREPGEAHS